MKENFKILRDAIHELPNNLALAVADLFALGCYIHKQGNTQAGLKAITTAIKMCNNTNRNIAFNKIITNIDGNEDTFARQIGAHLEINKLFHNKE